MSIENELSVKEDFILDSYFLLKRVSQSDLKAYGLDTSDTVVEHVPLIIAQKDKLPLKRRSMEI